jgi:Zn ribbon nucleic-acid-binding protein
MAKVKCYAPDGTEVMKEPVDARECVEHCGFTMEPVDANSKESEDKTLDKMNKKELIAEAESLDIELDGSENKAVIISKIDAKLEED